MRNLLYAITAVIVTCAGLLLADPALAEKRVALVIGNAAYKYATPLNNTLNDAKVISSVLTKSGFDVVESRADLGVVDFKRALRDFVHTARDADIAVVYFAGHGIEIRGSNYLVPIDAKLASDFDADDEAVTLERIVLAVEPVKQLRLIILDACRDNPFMRKMQRAIAQRAVTGGLAPVEPTTGNTLVAFAAKAGSTSYDGSGANSPFTTALVKHIAEPGLDIRIALGRVRDEVIRSTGNRQEPFIYGSLGGSTIALVPAPQVADPRTAASQVQVDYEFAERVGNRSAWEAFLATHQTGYYANLARAQLAKLGQSPAKPATPPPTQMAKRTPGGGTITAKKPEPEREEARPQQEARLDFSPRPDRDDAPPAGKQPEAAVDPCKRDSERLARLRANPAPEEVIALERELGCPRLKPQVMRLRESVVGPLPANESSPATSPERPGTSPAESQSAAIPAAKPFAKAVAPESARTANDSCTQEQARLNELRARPTPDEVLRFERDLGCERLRAQVLRLKESLAIK